MTPFEVEKERLELLNKISKSSNKTKVYLLRDFINVLILQKDPLVFESYIFEFVEIYLSVLANYTPFFTSPQNTELIIEQINYLADHTSLNEYHSRFKHVSNSISSELSKLTNVLNGLNIQLKHQNKLYFPLLEVSNIKYSWGSLESINIVIKRSSHTKFIFVPSNGNIDQSLLNQAQISLKLAQNYFKDYKNISRSEFEVLIYFENLEAQYAGNSLGMALTIGFIQALSELFNLPYLTMIESGVVMTGGIDDDEKPIKSQPKIIEQKIETVFFSWAAAIIVSFHNLPEAVRKLDQLNSLYPNRKLKIVGISNLGEIINRRDLVILKRQNIFFRAFKAAVKNWITSIIVIAICFVSALLFITSIDNNPTTAQLSDHTLYIKNKSGNILWQKHISDWVNNSEALKKALMITDLNNDGKNEVLLTSEVFDDDRDFYEKNRIACFDNYGNLLWKYFFLDKVSSKREDLSIYYGFSYIIGAIDINNQKRLYFSVRHSNSYSAAIYSLDPLTGKRVGTTLWNAGYIGDGLIYDFNHDSLPEIIFTFANNGLKRTGIAVISIDNADGQAPTSEEYSFNNIKIASFKAYILVPNTDYNRYIKAFQNGYNLNSLRLREDEKTIYFSSIEGLGPNLLCLTYKLDFNLKNIDPFAQSDFTAYRDALVREGKLKPPFTDTKEYYNILIPQVEYWNNKKFIHIK